MKKSVTLHAVLTAFDGSLNFENLSTRPVPSSFSRSEQPQHFPNREMAVAICKILGLRPDYLYSREDLMDSKVKGLELPRQTFA